MALIDAYTKVRKNNPERHANDYYPTSPIATYALVNYCKKHGLWIPKNIWEPAAGRGWMSAELQRLGYQVTSTDLFPYDDSLVPVVWPVDFLSPMPKQFYEHPPQGVITNPPYKNRMAEKFLRRALTVAPFVAMLTRVTFTEALERYELFTHDPPAKILFMSGRFSCDEDLLRAEKWSGGMVSYIWMIWIRDVLPQAPGWINMADTLAGWTREGGVDYFRELCNKIK